ncbi:TerC/Alx family metal homeostasis membrane protein [Mizugakiibacter sediminis]|uniref:TerC/Alx family metal homeostasis membrane protein n=1 Tax=Mizugakiibacter sediminis TaxID=1475481 RepID=UPI003CCD9033
MAHTGTPLLYLGFGLLVAVLLAVDFALLRTQGRHKVSVREAALWSVVWIAAAAAFGAWLWWHLHGEYGAEVARRKTLEYATGYLIEKGLAVENVFVWITIFTYFAIPAELQKRVLLWGVVGAIVMRAVLIYLGAVLIRQFDWIFYVFGAFLLGTGIKMFFFTGKTSDLGRNPLLRWLRGHLPITPELRGERFLVTERGRRALTPLFLVLVLVEVTDLVFAVDSIPAIFSVTADPFIVFTANTFAILGLHAMYFLLADMAGRFHLLGYGLALIITLVGAKMLLMDVYKIPVTWMLGAVAAVLAASIAASLLVPPRAPRA